MVPPCPFPFLTSKGAHLFRITQGKCLQCTEKGNGQGFILFYSPPWTQNGSGATTLCVSSRHANRRNSWCRFRDLLLLKSVAKLPMQYVYKWKLNKVHENNSSALLYFRKILSGQRTRRIYEILAVHFINSSRYLLQNIRGKHWKYNKGFLIGAK